MPPDLPELSSDTGANDATVIATGAHDEQRALGVLTLAFAADPANRWLFPKPHHYLRLFPVFARALGGAAFAHGTAFITAGGSAAALWLPPGCSPDEQALVRLVEEDVAEDKRGTMFGVMEEMGRHHPAEPHWYLPFIGVEPARQGGGLGGALLDAQLAVCDRTGLPAYLESTNPRNRPLYERHGFAAVAEIKVGDCPVVVPMLRRPRPPGAR
jgi:GNAT superfamily N-acetyltransferase